MTIYKATIVPTVSGGNIEVKISANSPSQAAGLIKTLPYFKRFAQQPTMTNELGNNLTRLSSLMAKAQAKEQEKLGTME